jgi:hypothetical protein
MTLGGGDFFIKWVRFSTEMSLAIISYVENCLSISFMLEEC